MSSEVHVVAQEYSDLSYWDERYRKSDGACFDWYQRYDTLKHVLNLVIPKDASILQVGVGNSRLQLDMTLDGYASILSVDYSPVVIQQMRRSHQSHLQLQYAVADARNMPQYADAAFGAVLDKGTLDAMACSQNAATDIHSMLKESSRLLKPNGVFLGISYGSANSRMHCFLSQEFQWDPIMYTIDRTEAQLGDNGLFQDDKQLIIAGPYLPQDALELLDSESDGTHYVYVCKKHDSSVKH